MTYNIRHGLGGDGRVDLGRIADVIASYEPDVVGLQEVDVGHARSGAIDQASELARRLGLEATFAPCITRGAERYGIATLARVPVQASRQLVLPARPHRRSEPRCALVTRLAWPGHDAPLDVVNTHLSVVGRERACQLAELADRVDAPEVVLLGDLNCTPWSRALRTLRGTLRSATRARSWPAWLPVIPLDHILYRGPLAVLGAGTWVSRTARVASDHLPVVAELAYTKEAA